MAQSAQQFQYANVAPKIKQQPRRRVQPRPQKVRFAPVAWRQDVRHLMSAIVIIAMFAMGSVWITNQTTAFNEQAQVKSAQLDKLRNANNDAKEQISALTTQDRLNDIAQKAGMTLQNQNIKNVK